VAAGSSNSRKHECPLCFSESQQAALADAYARAGVAEERTCLHRHAWWMSLRSAEERLGVETPTVVLPRTQLFDAAALAAIVDRVGRGELP
jgi:hypothetical protein